MTRRMILVLVFLVATAGPFRSVAEAPPKEYVDHQYQFAFQFPADWKIEKNPLASVRAANSPVVSS